MTGDATVVIRLSVEPGHVLELTVYEDGSVYPVVVRSAWNKSKSGKGHSTLQARTALWMMKPLDVENALRAWGEKYGKR